MMVFLRRLSTALLAFCWLVAVPFEAAMAQGGPTIGTPGGASQTAPSNSEGFRAGGTGVVGGTQVVPGGSTSTVRPAPRRPRRQQARRVQPRPRPRAAITPSAVRPVPGDAAPATPVPGTVPVAPR